MNSRDESKTPTNGQAALEAAAFEMFAQAYPHEAAAMDWPAFVKYTQKVNPAIPEAEIRRLLEETARG